MDCLVSRKYTSYVCFPFDHYADKVQSILDIFGAKGLIYLT